MVHIFDPPFPKVLDACSAPGNKTIHLAALMRDKGKIVACELNKQRVHRLEDTIRLSGASSILLPRLPVFQHLLTPRLYASVCILFTTGALS